MFSAEPGDILYLFEDAADRTDERDMHEMRSMSPHAKQ